MLTCIIIDDEPLARELILEYLGDYPQIEVVAQCGDGYEGIKALNQHQPALLFLDIQMPKINGFEMLELYDQPIHVIFSTAFDQYALKAFESNAIDYLLKPYTKERFDRAIQKWLAIDTLKSEVKIPTQREVYSDQLLTRIVVKTQQGIKIIPVHSIDYFEAYGDYIKIYTKQEMYVKKETMSNLEKNISSDIFIRSHRSYLINTHQIQRIELAEKDQYIVFLQNHSKGLHVSRDGYKRLKQILRL